MYSDLTKSINRSRAKESYLDADWNADWNAEKDNRLLSFYVKVSPILLACERCSIFIHDPETGTVWLKSGTGVAEKQIEVSKTDSIVGEVIRTGIWKSIDNLADMPGPHKDIAVETGFETRNLLCIPIRSLDGNSVTGAIQALNKTDGSFDQADREMLEELAHFLELTIENVYYNQEMNDTLASTLDTLKKITVGSVIVIVFLTLLIIAYVGFSALG